MSLFAAEGDLIQRANNNFLCKIFDLLAVEAIWGVENDENVEVCVT